MLSPSMALRRLLLQACRTSAANSNSYAVLDGSDFARISSGLGATTSCAGGGDDQKGATFFSRQERWLRTQGPESVGCASFGVNTVDGAGSSSWQENKGSHWQQEASFSRELDSSDSALRGQPLSHFKQIQPGLTSWQNQSLATCCGLKSTGCIHTGSMPHVRHFANAALAEEDPNVDPSVSMHRELFLRASSRKVEKPQPVIKAYLREAPGKIPNKKERRQGLVPGIVFSGRDGHKGGNKRLISVGYKQLSSILQPLGKFFFSAMTWDLEVYEGRPGEEGTSKKTVEKVVPKSVHLDAATDEPLNVTFMRVFPDEKVTVDVPLVFLGEDACPGLKKGGRLNTVRRLVRYECPGDKVPPYLEVDISRLNIGQSVLLKDLPADPALRLVGKDTKMPVLKIAGRTQAETADGE